VALLIAITSLGVEGEGAIGVANGVVKGVVKGVVTGGGAMGRAVFINGKGAMLGTLKGSGGTTISS